MIELDNYFVQMKDERIYPYINIQSTNSRKARKHANIVVKREINSKIVTRPLPTKPCRLTIADFTSDIRGLHTSPCQGVIHCRLIPVRYDRSPRAHAVANVDEDVRDCRGNHSNRLQSLSSR